MNDLKNIENQYSFWKLINEYMIEIPIIQRDYAQGRATENASEIRAEILDSIKHAITTNHTLDFDFIYGTVENGKLYPLDGQQRLTTLYLLHWYAAQKDNTMDIAKGPLSNFTYKTRISSKDFCDFLINTTVSLQGHESLSKYLMNENGFFRAWKNDPTIKAMLCMLDSIHQKFFDIDNLFTILSSAENKVPVTFYYLPMDKYALSDDLYIKMNARGKALSVFENFKAKFIQHLKENNLPYAHFEKSIDGSWTDLLWDYRSDDNTIDKQFMNLFCFFTEMIFLLSQNEVVDIDSPFIPQKIGPLINFYDDENKVEELYSLFDLWKSKSEVSSYIHDVLSSHYIPNHVNLFDDNVDIFNAITTGESVTYPNKILLFSMMRRLIELGKTSSLSQMRLHVRFARNIMIKVRFFSKRRCTYYSDFRFGRHGIPYIHLLAWHMCSCQDIYSYLTHNKNNIDGISKESLEQEIAKAKIIIANPEKEAIIHSFEDMSEFKGAIHNILPHIEKSNCADLTSKVLTMFNSGKGEHIVRTLLSFGDYGIKIGKSSYGDRCFYGNLNDWYPIMSFQGGTEYTNQISNFIRAYDETSYDSVPDVLDSIIRRNLSTISKQDWRYCIVKYNSTVAPYPPYLTNTDIIFTFEPMANGGFLVHRLNGIRLNSYHVVPEYLEAVRRLGNICSSYCIGYGAENPGSIKIKSNDQLKIQRTCKGNLLLNHPDRLEKTAKLVISEHNKLNTSNMNIVEKIISLIEILNNYL